MNLNKAEFEAAFGTSSQLPSSDLPEIAFAGRSNVGKSSLLNRLFNRKALARVSSVPGKTATINFYKVDDARFVDLPGYGYAKVPEQIRAGWRKLVEQYVSDRQNVSMVFVLIDSRHEPTYLDELMVTWLEYYEIPYAIVLTKSDKISKNKMDKQIYRCAKIVNNEELCIDYIPFSIITGEGRNEMLGLISKSLKNPRVKNED